MNNIKAHVQQWYDITQQELARAQADVKRATDAYTLAAAQAQALTAVAQAVARLLNLLHDIGDGAFRSGFEIDEVFSAEAAGLGPIATPLRLDPGEYSEDNPTDFPLGR